MHIFHAAFTRVLGGLEQSYINTTEALASCGHKVTALIRHDAPYRAEVAARASAMHTLNPVGFYDVFAAWRIRKLIGLLKPDLILAHNARAIALMQVAAKGSSVPVVGVTHSYKTSRTLRADALIVLSEHMRQHFQNAGYQRQMAVIPNLIRLSERPKRRAHAGAPIIGAIGRFTEEKGFQDFLQALYLLKQSGLPFIARIGGDGPDAPQLKRQAEVLDITSNIEWLGWVEDKNDFYTGLDVLCLPSREDSFPMVLLEAMAQALPIVATDAFGPASMITHGENGLLVPRRNADAVAKALHAVLTQPELTRRISQGAWQTIQSYDFPAIAERWDTVLNSITSATTRRKAA